MNKKGWQRESGRHSLASRGVHTTPHSHHHHYAPMKSVPRRSAYQERQMETFARFNSEPKDWKWNHKEPDEVEGGVCDLCGYAPLRWVYTINLVTEGHPSRGHQLGIGSECVNNFFLADEYERSLFRQTEGKRKKVVAARNKLTKDFGVSKDEAEYIMDKFPSLEVRRDPDKGPQLQYYGRHMAYGGRTRYGWFTIDDDEVRRMVRQKRKGDIRIWMEHLDDPVVG